ncbi:hypothetical protein ST47_g6847 [Ascochyta rabiei]|uniref:Uncharacterized protein n=1 Tax=Didymella rabiei TaxID=5454 RepID=A0A163BUW8_DIDRA|nr:hypothetical protein ST47_g6847 [Ascochyta rabiei]
MRGASTAAADTSNDNNAAAGWVDAENDDTEKGVWDDNCNGNMQNAGWESDDQGSGGFDMSFGAHDETNSFESFMNWL